MAELHEEILSLKKCNKFQVRLEIHSVESKGSLWNYTLWAQRLKHLLKGQGPNPACIFKKTHDHDHYSIGTKTILK